ncbi:MAG: hypothetical protein MASP_01184 [Candidatus Methanolliviera sp. GoM_asphalt]|nr:MAG: hypothetical protein MASP_01184 [Candidatus Methanolliviera sp. GoM_asphalt]
MIKICKGKNMRGRLGEIFKDERLAEKIRKRLPYLFQLAELESPKIYCIASKLTYQQNPYLNFLSSFTCL